MRCLTVAAVALLPALFGDPVAAAEAPLWTVGTTGSRSADAPIGLQSFIKLARTLGPAVVNIITVQSGGDERPGGGDKPRRPGRGQGTGFIIQKDGYILTNAHVVEDADEIRVRLADERDLPAGLIGRDDRTDIALLKIDAGHELPVAPLGDSNQVQIGEWVIAIGNPFGLDHTVTAGIISAKGRRDIRPGGARGGYYDFIQTDASINPGNSGGPLINTRGEVIGINTAINAQAQGIGFAIPINMAKVIAPLLRHFGKAPRSWMGVYPQSVTANLQRAFNLPDRRGALVSEVVADSPAAHVGLQSGDLIRDFDGHAIKRADDLTWLVATTRAGRRVPVTILRHGTASRLEIVLELAPEDPRTAHPSRAKPAHQSPLGMTVAEISPGIARELGNSKLRGVVVMSVETESPASEAGIERGDLVLRIGETTIDTLDDYAHAVRTAPQGDMLRLLVKHDGKSSWVAFQKR